MCYHHRLKCLSNKTFSHLINLGMLHLQLALAKPLPYLTFLPEKSKRNPWRTKGLLKCDDSNSELSPGTSVLVHQFFISSPSVHLQNCALLVSTPISGVRIFSDNSFSLLFPHSYLLGGFSFKVTLQNKFILEHMS